MKTPFDFYGTNNVVKEEYRKQEEGKDGDDVTDEQEISNNNTLILSLSNRMDFVKQSLIEGEGSQIEFKPSLVYNFLTKQPGIGVKTKIAQAICAFLNSHGGFLFIGVNDNKEIVGLEADFSLCPPNKQPHDFFKLEFDNMVYQFFERNVISCITTAMANEDKKSVFMVEVRPSKQPVFIKYKIKNENKYDKEFYIRGAGSSLPMPDKEDIVKYCLEKWGRG